MRKVIVPIALGLFMAPILNASSYSEKVALDAGSSCWDQAEAGFQAAKGSHEDKFKVFDAVYAECMG